MGGPAGPDAAFLVERELFAQKEILGRERTFRSETEHQKAEQIGKKVQPKQAGFYHDRCPWFSLSSLQIGHNLARFKSRR
jgi:hypothetical protein